MQFISTGTGPPSVANNISRISFQVDRPANQRCLICIVGADQLFSFNFIQLTPYGASYLSFHFCTYIVVFIVGPYSLNCLQNCLIFPCERFKMLE